MKESDANKRIKKLMRTRFHYNIKYLIEDEYEDACYELAYNMSPVTKIIFQLKYGPSNETNKVKMFLQNIFLYHEFNDLNLSETRTIQQIERTIEQATIINKMANTFDLFNF